MEQLRRVLLICGLAGVFCFAAGQVSSQTPAPAGQPAVAGTNAVVAPPDSALQFDSDSKDYHSKYGEMKASFVFNVTNTWTNDVQIDQVKTSCGCTVAKLPSQPWILIPGTNGQISAEMNLIGHSGTMPRTITVFVHNGNNKMLHVTTFIAPPPETGPQALTEEQRKAAMMVAKTNRLAIFHGDCAACHVDPAKGKTGQDLYVASCGICHEDPHRDSAVPDLHALKQPTNFDYWKTIITFGKPNTLMPGFAVSEGGNLTDDQITSLANFLTRTLSRRFLGTNAVKLE